MAPSRCSPPRGAPLPSTWWPATPPVAGRPPGSIHRALPRLGDVVSAQLLAEVHEAGEGEVEVWS
jgi:hypothetical protein